MNDVEDLTDAELQTIRKNYVNGRTRKHQTNIHKSNHLMSLRIQKVKKAQNRKKADTCGRRKKAT